MTWFPDGAGGSLCTNDLFNSSSLPLHSPSLCSRSGWSRLARLESCLASVVSCFSSARRSLPTDPDFVFSSLLQIDESKKDRFALLPEDYLQGVITLVNELSRLAINSVTLQNYTYPLVISSFVGEMFAGFQLLNLKNDSLRRRFDSLKYDLKKIEEVVYDISLRGLTAPKA
jgi:hypothetical protein